MISGLGSERIKARTERSLPVFHNKTSHEGGGKTMVPSWLVDVFPSVLLYETQIQMLVCVLAWLHRLKLAN